MQYEPLSRNYYIEKANLLTNRIIFKALQSNRGDIIRVMNVADLKMMKESVFNAVYNKLELEVQLAHEYECDKYVRELDGIASDPTAEFKPRSDVEIEEEVSAFFEIDGKLQYREVIVESISTLLGFDKFVKSLKRSMKMGSHVMRYGLYSLAYPLAKTDILTNRSIIDALQRAHGDDLRTMGYAEYKQLQKDVFSVYCHNIVDEAEEAFEQACDEHDDVRVSTFGPFG